MNRIMLAVGVIVFCSYVVLARVAQSITKVDRLCGYLVSETQAGRYSISREKMILYRREPAIDCCKAQNQVQEVQTRKDGRFEFRHVPAGVYWIVAVVNNREFKMPIDFAPTKDSQDCSWNLYTIEGNGTFVLMTYVD